VETIKEIVCRNCKRLLDKSKNLSDIARQMQVNPTTISRWKSGDHAPELDKIDRLAEILEVDPLEFFKRDDASSDGSLEVIKKIASLGPTELAIFKQNLDALTKPVGKKRVEKDA
jgi:transcriptional regulator with XRE-family HTH domain